MRIVEGQNQNPWSRKREKEALIVCYILLLLHPLPMAQEKSIETLLALIRSHTSRLGTSLTRPVVVLFRTKVLGQATLQKVRCISSGDLKYIKAEVAPTALTRRFGARVQMAIYAQVSIAGKSESQNPSTLASLLIDAMDSTYEEESPDDEFSD